MTSIELTTITARLRETQALVLQLIEHVDFLALATDRLAIAVEQRNALDLITTPDMPMPEPSLPSRPHAGSGGRG